MNRFEAIDYDGNGVYEIYEFRHYNSHDTAIYTKYKYPDGIRRTFKSIQEAHEEIKRMNDD